MDLHGLPQDVYENHSPVPSTPLNAFNDSDQVTEPQSAWDSSLIEPLTDMQMMQAMSMPYIAHQQQFQVQLQGQGKVQTPTCDTSMQPPIATLDSESSSAHAQSPVSASTSNASPVQTQFKIYDPPKMIKLTERAARRTKSKVKSQSQAMDSGSTKSPLRPPCQTKAGFGLHSKRMSVRPQSEVDAGERTGLYDTPSSSKGKAQAVVGGKDSSKTVSSRVEARQISHPYAPPQRRCVSGPLPSINTSLGGTNTIQGNRPLSTRSPTHSAPHLSPQVHTSDAPPLTRGPRYLVRTDVYHNMETNMITAMLEIPGVPFSTLRVALGVDPSTKMLQLVVRGRSRTLYPDGDPVDEEKEKQRQAAGKGMFMRRERKCGEFRRSLVIPPGTKNDDIKAWMKDGILFIRYPALVRPPAQKSNQEDQSVKSREGDTSSVRQEKE